MPSTIPQPTPIMHFTQICNLPQILINGGLWATNFLPPQGREPASLAFSHIQGRRARMAVPVARGGTLHDYVPFYFAPRSPMLYVVSKGGVPGVACKQEQIMYTVTTAQTVAGVGLEFAFTDGHGTMDGD